MVRCVAATSCIWLTGLIVDQIHASPTVGLAFSDQTDSSGLAATHVSVLTPLAVMLSSAGTGDFNRDGWQDIIYLSSGIEPHRLFINNQDGTFTDRASEWGINDYFASGGLAIGDVNNDGWLDIFVNAFGPNGGTFAPGYNRLYIHNGSPETPQYENKAVEAGVAYTSPLLADGFGAALGDYDLDGDLDLATVGWIINSSCNRLYENQGDGTFVDVSVEAGVLDNSVRGFSPRFADMDGDRYPELLIAADFQTSRYYVNNRDGTFSDRTVVSGTGLDGNGMGHTIGDLNNDGLLDWYVTSIYTIDTVISGVPGTGNMYYVNQGDHSFVELSGPTGVNDGGWGWGTIAVDVDNDTHLDIVETNGWPFFGEWVNEASYLFRNNGDGTCTDIANDVGVVHAYQGRGLFNADFDRDGDQDLFITSYNGPFKVFRNDLHTDSAHWLAVEFDTSAHPQLAPDGYGTIVRATIGDTTLTRAVTGGSNYLSQSELPVHFGLGDAGVVDELRIEWTTGETTIMTHVEADRYILIVASAPVDKADFDADGVVGPADLALLLGTWGLCAEAPVECVADLTGDGTVGPADLAQLLGAWGG